ncbi:HAMP domain-containing methyl-accepting chemotaxis protein [Acidisoma sp. C75]
MRFFENMKIRNKVLSGYAVVLLVSLAVGVVSMMQLVKLNAIANDLNDNVATLTALSAMRADGFDVAGLTSLGMTSATASDSLDQFNSFVAMQKKAEADFRARWAGYSAALDPGEETKDAQAFKTSFDLMVETSNKCALAIAQGDFPTANQLILQRLGSELTNFRQAIIAATNYEQRSAMQSKADANRRAHQGLLIIGIGIAVLLLAILASVALSVVNIARPIVRMTALMQRLATNDTELTITGTDRRDEIGEMAGAVQIFKDNAIERARLEAEAAEFQRDLDRKLRETEQAFTEAGHEQKVAMEGVSAALSRLAEGDLTARFDAGVSAAYQSLRDDFNAALDTLQETMRAIAANTVGVRSGAAEIQQAASDLSRRTEQQAANLEETAAALDEITATVRKTADSVGEARQLVQDTRSSAERSGTVVRDAVKAMSGIEQSSHQIANIITVIDEIAFQTNLLALNAGVEAARAGDAGRGFAVVATEVRTLAQRSADAAKEIKALILSSGQQVELGVKLVSETGNVLAVIVDQVMRLNGLMSDVANSAKEQSTGLQEVNTAMNQMDQVTQQNAAMVEEATAASHGLAREAEDLAHLVSQFKIESDGVGSSPAAGARGADNRPKETSRARTREAAY